jgi:hypothetical protein
MGSLFAGCAIEEALRHGNAILKFITANDVGLTGSHQCGFYLPKAAWRMFSPHPPEKGSLAKHSVQLQWPDGSRTGSAVTWYGRGTRSEYRLTRFGRNCPWLASDTVGNLLVLVPRTEADFAAFVFDRDEDIEDVSAALGTETMRRWSIYQNGAALFEDPGDCLRRRVCRWVSQQTGFPSGDALSAIALDAAAHCHRGFDSLPVDERLLRACEVEYAVYRLLEAHLSTPEISQPFTGIDAFLATASRILNRRKARAGRSLENHVHAVLQMAGIPHEMRPAIDGEPDIVVPGASAYRDASWPENKLFIIGIKTTCKDRWRQVLNEGRRKREKYLVTIQPGISARQLGEMHESGITLVVPQPLHREYPAHSGARLLSIGQWLQVLREAL